MQKQTMKRIWIGATALVAAAGLGACADQPMGVEEPYEVQMDGETTEDSNCIIIDGVIYCNN